MPACVLMHLKPPVTCCLFAKDILLWNEDGMIGLTMWKTGMRSCSSEKVQYVRNDLIDNLTEELCCRDRIKENILVKKRREMYIIYSQMSDNKANKKNYFTKTNSSVCMLDRILMHIILGVKME